MYKILYLPTAKEIIIGNQCIFFDTIEYANDYIKSNIEIKRRHLLEIVEVDNV